MQAIKHPILLQCVEVNDAVDGKLYRLTVSDGLDEYGYCYLGKKHNELVTSKKLRRNIIFILDVFGREKPHGVPVLRVDELRLIFHCDSDGIFGKPKCFIPFSDRFLFNF
jgi:hypothetical protein